MLNVSDSGLRKIFCSMNVSLLLLAFYLCYWSLMFYLFKVEKYLDFLMRVFGKPFSDINNFFLSYDNVKQSLHD